MTAAYTQPIMPDEITVSLAAGPPPGRAFRSGIWPVIYDGQEYWINAEVSTALPYNDQVWAVAEAAARQIRVSKEVIREPPGPPVITSSLTAQATTGAVFNYQITASGRPTSFGASGLPVGTPLPAGLSITSNGRITGTPTATGTFPIQISAYNVSGSDTQTLTLTVSVPIPVVSAGAITGTPGTAITTFQIAATNPPILSYAVTPALPTGLSLNTTNGQITGTPAAVSSGIFQITATNAGGTSDPANLTITISAIALPVVSAGTITGAPGTAITTFQIAATNPPILSYAVTPALPTGLSLNTTNGQITGTPAAASSGTFQITATNAGGTSAPATLTITIAVSTGWQVTNELPGNVVVIGIGATKTALGALPNWTGWLPAYQVDMTDDLYNAATPAAQTVRLFAHFTPYATTPEVEVPFDNFSNPMVTGNAIQQWGYDSGDNTVYLSGGQNSTGNPIQLRLVKS